MATRKSSSSTKAKSNKSKKQRMQEMERRQNFRTEVILWLMVAFCILLFISNFGVGGIVGSTLSGFFFGVFGIFEYIFPIVLLVSSFFVASNKSNKDAVFKCVTLFFFIWFVCVFACLIYMTVRGVSDISPVDIFLNGYKNENRMTGGIFGASIAHLLVKWFGIIGAYVFDVILILICIILYTGKSALKGVQKGSKKVYESAKESNERMKEYREYKEQERRKKRMDQKVSGVSRDTRIAPDYPAEGSDEMGELHPDSFADIRVLAEKKVALSSNSTFEAKPENAEYTPANEIKITGNYVDRLSEQIIANAMEPENKESDIPKEPVTRTRKQKLSEEEKENSVEQISQEIAEHTESKEYMFPPTYLLKQGNKKASSNTESYLRETANKLQQTLKNFGVNVTVTDISCGPAVTRYEIQPEMGVKVSKIVGLADDIKLNLAAADIRIEAPIPGKAAVGIEVPNKENVMVSFRDLIESEEFQNAKSKISFAVGKDIAGKTTVTDIAKMPHLLIAGATGSGKSVCINTIIMSILYKARPDEVKLIMIDPKVVELSVYNGIPHLMIPVVTDPKKAAGALNWAVSEMTERYNRFAEAGVREINGYNQKLLTMPEDQRPAKMPQIVIIVDELADLMMVASNDVEEAICRLAQLARAAGIHLIIATQRPSVNVITGLIKANMPSRIAFAVTSGVDSRTILDMVGAEKLLGKGDMLFNPQGIPKPLRVQGAFVSDDEVQKVVKFLTDQNLPHSYSEEVQQKIESIQASSGNSVSISEADSYDDGRDSYFVEAGRIITDKEKASIGMLQRYLKVGFNRAARIMDQLEEAGVVGPEEGTKPRRVMMTSQEFESLVDDNQ